MTYIRLRYVANVNPQTPAFTKIPEESNIVFLPMESVWPNKWRELASTRSKSSVDTGFTRFQDGDILVPKITPTFEASRAIRVDGLPHKVGAGSTELHVVRPGPGIDGQYLLYQMQTHHFLKFGESEMYGVAGQKRVPDDFLRNLHIFTPPLDEQRRIADFLDIEANEIDRVTALFSEFYSLTCERNSTVTESALTEVTHGTEKRKPVKYICQARDTRVNGRENLPLLSVSIHSGVIPRNLLTEDMPRSEEFSNYKICHPGDIVINRMRAFQGGAGVSREYGMVSPDYLVLRPNEGTHPRLLHHLFRSKWFVGEMSARIRGIGSVEQGNVRTPRINWEDLGRITITLPHLKKQLKITEKIDTEQDKTERLRSAIAKQLNLLTERRQALITAAVTGQIDVTTARGADVP